VLLSIGLALEIANNMTSDHFNSYSFVASDDEHMSR